MKISATRWVSCTASAGVSQITLRRRILVFGSSWVLMALATASGETLSFSCCTTTSPNVRPRRTSRYEAARRTTGLAELAEVGSDRYGRKALFAAGFNCRLMLD